MNPTTQYILTCRTLLTLDPEDLSSHDQLMRHIVKLRQLLQCKVCRAICQDPVSGESCQHLVCYGCLRAKIASNIGCRFCKNSKELKRDPQNRLLIACYRKLCQIIMKSSVATATKPENGGKNRLWFAIEEANSYNPAQMENESNISNFAKNISDDPVTLEVVGQSLLSTSTETPVPCQPHLPAGKQDGPRRSFPPRRKGKRRRKNVISRTTNINHEEFPLDASYSEFDKPATLLNSTDCKESFVEKSSPKPEQEKAETIAPIKVKVLRVNDEARYLVANDFDSNRGNRDDLVDGSLPFRKDKSDISNFVDSMPFDARDCSTNTGCENRLPDELTDPQGIVKGQHLEQPVRKYSRGGGRRRKKGRKRFAFPKEPNTSNSFNGEITSVSSHSKSVFENPPRASSSSMCQGCQCKYCKLEDNLNNRNNHCVGDCCYSPGTVHCNGKRESEEEIEILN